MKGNTQQPLFRVPGTKIIAPTTREAAAAPSAYAPSINGYVPIRMSEAEKSANNAAAAKLAKDLGWTAADTVAAVNGAGGRL